MANLTTGSIRGVELSKESTKTQKRVEQEFMEYFSFGKYLELHQRVEYMENELDQKQVVKKRMPTHGID